MSATFSLFYKFKMLVVLMRGPVTAPVEAGLAEEAEAEVVVVYLVGEVPVAVTIGLCRGVLLSLLLHDASTIMPLTRIAASIQFRICFIIVLFKSNTNSHS